MVLIFLEGKNLKDVGWFTFLPSLDSMKELFTYIGRLPKVALCNSLAT